MSQLGYSAAAASGKHASRMPRHGCMVAAAVLAGCGADDTDPVVIDLAAVLDADRAGAVVQAIAVDGAREVRILAGDAPVVIEAWAAGGTIDGVPTEQLASGASAAWLVPRPVEGDVDLVVTGDGEVVLSVWARGVPPPPVARARSLAWFDPALLDDPTAISFAQVIAAIADDGDGGALLDRWFRAFATGPGAGRATFAQFLDEIVAAQGPDPTAWDLGALPFRVTGVHNRVDLARGADCGELRVSIASTHPTFSPVHLIFLFRQPPAADDVTPDGRVHCRGTARRWAGLTALEPAAWAAAARDLLAAGIAGDRFALAESVELSISPWQWRQWLPDGAGGFTNPPLFETVDVDRVNAPGPTRDAFLAAVTADAALVAARRWLVPERFRAPTAEVQPTDQGGLVDLSPIPDVLAAYPELPRAVGMIGCPRCHTDTADFIHTSLDRVPSPFYDRELDARAARLDALGRGELPVDAPFGPLQPL